VVKLRALTIAMSVAWFALAAIAIAENLAPPAWVGWCLIATAAYFLGLPLLRDSPLARD
jgi:phosphatidylcholine synthase